MTIIDQSFVTDFRKNGVATIVDFLSPDEIDQLKNEAFKLSEDADPKANRSIFGTGNQQITDDYFINSGDKIRYFFEKSALDDDGNLLVESKARSLNKIGHALHWLNPTFRKVTFGDRVKSLAQSLGMVDPIVTQSMYIFKNPFVGGEVAPHRDGTFLHTEPGLNLLGIWIALENATIENGCLWFVPGSHETKIKKRFVRNSDPCGPRLKFIGSDNEDLEVPDSAYVPIPVSKGTCVLIHGQVLHKSYENKSAHPRPAYTFHLMDMPTKEIVWCPDNWLQPTSELPFPSLYCEKV